LRAQALRHVIGRAHTTQGLLGSADLLPLWGFDGGMEGVRPGRVGWMGVGFTQNFKLNPG
jgi:hypothetical protein